MSNHDFRWFKPDPLFQTRLWKKRIPIALANEPGFDANAHLSRLLGFDVTAPEVSVIYLHELYRATGEVGVMVLRQEPIGS